MAKETGMLANLFAGAAAAVRRLKRHWRAGRLLRQAHRRFLCAINGRHPLPSPLARLGRRGDQYLLLTALGHSALEVEAGGLALPKEFWSNLLAAATLLNHQDWIEVIQTRVDSAQA